MAEQMMDALVWLGPREMRLQQMPQPVPASGEVLIDVAVAGICGSELSGYLGENSLRTPPLIMGHEAAGVIVAADHAALVDGTPAMVGTRVTFNPLITCGECDRCHAGHPTLCRRRALIGVHRPGAFARYVAVPATQCWALPDTMTAATGALTEPLACAVRAVRASSIAPGQTLLILGAGPIGLFCQVIARSLGVEAIIVSDMLPTRLAIAAAWGAQHTIDARAADVLAVMRDLAPGGADAVIDAVGATATRAQAIQVVVPGGCVVCIGLHDENSALPLNVVVRQEITLAGSFGYDQDDFAGAFALLARGVIQPDASWLEERPLAAGGDAFADLVAGRARVGKILLRPA